MTSDTPRPPMTQSEPALTAALRQFEREFLDALPPAGHPVVHGIFQRLPDRLAPVLAALAAQSPVQPVLSGLDEPTLTRILGEIAPIVGGDLLTGGVKHRIGLSFAILERLAATAPAADEDDHDADPFDDAMRQDR